MTPKTRIVLALLAAAWPLPALLADDVISYRDPKVKAKDKPADVKLKGKLLEESPGGVKFEVKRGKETETVSIKGEDITWIAYDDSAVGETMARPLFGKIGLAQNKDTAPKARDKALDEALAGFQDLEAKYSATPAGERDAQYNAARVMLIQAKFTDDPKKREERMDAAIKKLTEFKDAHAGTWQTTLVLKTLAPLHEERGEGDATRKVYEALAKLPGVPDDLRQEAELLVSRFLLRGDKASDKEANDAKSRLLRLSKELSPGDSRRPMVLAYIVEVDLKLGKASDETPKQLEKLIADSPDGRVRGIAYNLLGDYHRSKGQDEKAFWDYLRVDAQYKDDPEEQAKALWFLSELFDKVRRDPVRAKACRDQLLGESFSQTRYHRVAKTSAK